MPPETLILKLLEMEVPINWIGDGQTALMRAVSDGEPSTVELLLQQGANVTQQAVTIQHDQCVLFTAVKDNVSNCL